MPELPEVYNIASQMDQVVTGKEIREIEAVQEKCLNLTTEEFAQKLIGTRVQSVRSKGKWVVVSLSDDQMLLINFGMGADLLYAQDGRIQKKYQVKFGFDDGAVLTIHFWWFGYVHLVRGSELNQHRMFGTLGVDPISEQFTYEKFRSLLAGKKGGIKTFLLDQKYIAGIGNVYVQDILFRAGIHPSRKIPEISETEKRKLFEAVTNDLTTASEQGGLVYERDLFGKPGRFNGFLIAYRDGARCPTCGTVIQKIKTGSNASYICPKCQK